ncbi:DUF4382 domain-containing protein [Saccharolobus solfataricus]|uniref:DUF4382 domain-containing protein n=3 Tax=Saccharolobus solfataricus TaxID=2287 RepID=Q97VL2_SACS2|nr:DUF4382 domain-containing protein [Saccharolobus solfataricus]AAK42732.1 Conserved hypothetical protein [Saccharolobus solfataricus P2]AKA72829.1 DUF4382 domain-containing protein [Saccharolobus solfataricus]AKA75528.1 DUF4382 domain-containing protein [Saccharolobus solfataricus]AKA78221.1 DUF4382 domain-containing protein [Saccharolobus solfataricus]AZF67339.1 DUF4382 domain-containing protein [Saccharolobus solfataricus]
MNKAILGIVIVVLVLAGGVYYGFYYLTTGVVNVYIQDPPTSQGVKIYLTISSIMIHKVNASNDSWITISNKTITILLTSNMTFLASSRIPSGQYNEVFLEISFAQVQLGNVNISAKIPSGVFKIHIINGMDLKGGSSQSLLISFPHITYANGQIIISPSITAEVIS